MNKTYTYTCSECGLKKETTEPVPEHRHWLCRFFFRRPIFYRDYQATGVIFKSTGYTKNNRLSGNQKR